MSGVLGSIGLAALNTAANSVNNWLQGQSNVRNSKRLMDYQSKKQLETQSKLNALLYPQQVASMRMAGLNPAMISGPMSASSAAAPSATQNMPAVQFDAINAANAVSNLKLNDSQRDLNMAQAENLRSEAARNRQDVENMKLEQELLGNRLFTWFQDWQAEKSVQASQAYSNNQLGDYYGMQRNIGAQTITNLKEELLNLAETRQKIKAETAKAWSEKSYQDKVNNKYDEYMNAQIKQFQKYTEFMDHDDSRKAAEIVKRLVRMDIDNENAVWQQYILRDMHDAQSFQNYLNRKYSDDDRFLNELSTVLGVSSSAYGKAFGVPQTNYVEKYGPDGEFIGGTSSTSTWHW